MLVAADQDRYVSKDSVTFLHHLWPGSTLWSISGGHVTTFVLGDPVYRAAIKHALGQLPSGEDSSATPAPLDASG